MMAAKRKVPNGTKVATNDQAIIKEWIERHEAQGHIFFWYEPIGEVIHLVPSNWLDFGKAEYFKSLYRDAINLFLYERECEAMARYLVGQEDF
jgi:hypothetical protein